MLFFRGRVVWQRVMLLIAPILVVGTVLWQRQARFLSRECCSEPKASAPRLNEPPSGISSVEWQVAGAEMEGVTDSTFQCSVEEMPAYWRLLKWSARPPEGNGDQVDFRHVSFNELVNRPNAWRGRPVQIDLHVCRIVECAAPQNSCGIERLYEVWGWSDDSRGSLYVAVTPELPDGMSVGESVIERAAVCGYFFKVQAYLAAGSAAQPQPTAAPLVIGRLSRWDTPVAAFAQTNELWFGGAALLLAASFVFFLSQSSLFRLRHPRQQVRPKAAAKLENWVDSFAADLAADGPR
jgi:hypothetical protein